MSDPSPLWVDPTYLASVSSAEEEEAFLELEARMDRADDFASRWRDMGGAAPSCRPTVVNSFTVKDGDSRTGNEDDGPASSSSAVGRPAPRPNLSSTCAGTPSGLSSPAHEGPSACHAGPSAPGAVRGAGSPSSSPSAAGLLLVPSPPGDGPVAHSPSTAEEAA